MQTIWCTQEKQEVLIFLHVTIQALEWQVDTSKCPFSCHDQNLLDLFPNDFNTVKVTPSCFELSSKKLQLYKL